MTRKHKELIVKIFAAVFIAAMVVSLVGSSFLLLF